jgi:hypothetical protein
MTRLAALLVVLVGCGPTSVTRDPEPDAGPPDAGGHASPPPADAPVHRPPDAPAPKPDAPPATARLGVSPVSHDFGEVDLGSFASQRFTVTNLGTSSAGPVGVAVSGADAHDFSAVATTCKGPLTAGASCTVDVNFTPGLTGAEAAKLDIEIGGAPATSADLSGSGQAVGPAVLTMAPDGAALATPAGTRVSGAPFTVTNIGQSATPPLDVVLDGDRTEFTVAADSCTGAALAPGASCQVTPAFLPSAPGLTSARLTVGSSAGSVAVPLEGTATATLVVEKLGGGDGTLATDVDPGTCAPGCAELDAQFATWITITATPAPGSSLAGWDGCDDNPTPGSCLVAASAARRSVAAHFDVTVVGPAALWFTPGDQTLPAITAGEFSTGQTETLTNVGSSRSGPIALAVTGDSDAFSLVNDLCTGVALGPGESCTFVPKLTAYYAGTYSATVAAGPDASIAVDVSAAGLVDVQKIGSGDGTLDASVGLSCGPGCTELATGALYLKSIWIAAEPQAGSTLVGWGGCDENPTPSSCVVYLDRDVRQVNVTFDPVPPAVLTVSPGDESFAELAAGSSEPGATETLRNVGQSPSAPIALALTGDSAAFDIEADTCTGAVLAPGDSCTFTPGFAPADAGTYAATVTVAPDLSVSLSGAAHSVLDVQKIGAADGTIVGTDVTLPDCGPGCTETMSDDLYQHTATITATLGPNATTLSWFGCDGNPTPYSCLVHLDRALVPVTVGFDP